MTVTNKIIVSVSGEDDFIDYESFGLSFESDDNAVLVAIRPFILEKYGVDLNDERRGQWLYKTRKAISNRNIHVIPNSTAGTQAQELVSLGDDVRNEIFQTLVSGCMHLWSKGKPQPEKIEKSLALFSRLAQEDPMFLAHFTSYAFGKLDSKDLKVLAVFASSLSDADGTPFSVGSDYKKPNWRIISQAVFQQLDPKLAYRVLKMANTKQAFGQKAVATHFSKHLRKAAIKYLRYREANLKSLEGIKKVGLGKTMRSLYRITRIAPSPDACRILGWKQKAGFPGANVEIKSIFSFDGLTDEQLAMRIKQEQLKPTAVLGALDRKMSPVIAALILEQATGDQALILASMFEEQGLFQHQAVKTLFEQKVKTAKNSIDRVEKIEKEALSEDTMKVLKEAKAEIRKQKVGDIGKVFEHIDISGSMHGAIEVAIQKSAIFAECVQKPEENFHWGTFASGGTMMKRPDSFVKDAFASALYGVRPGGSTDCFALYQKARELGCDLDVYITDGGHTDGSAAVKLKSLIEKYGRPKAAIIIKVGGYVNSLEEGLKSNNIPFTTVSPEALSESALVAQMVRTASFGSVSAVDEIMNYPLTKLPRWWFSVPGK